MARTALSSQQISQIQALLTRATFDITMKDTSFSLDAATQDTATKTASGQAAVMGTTALTAGKWYFEVTFVSGTSSGNASVGVCSRNGALGTQIGYNDSSGNSIACFQTSGNVYANGTKVASGVVSFGTAGNVICVAVDVSSRLIWFRLGASGNWNNSGTAAPSTDTGGLTIPGTYAILPAVCSDSASVWTANFGQSTFTGTVPTGYNSWLAASYLPKTTSGVVTLSAGTATVSYPTVTANSRILLTAQDNNSTGSLRVSARTAGTSFTITSTNSADSGVVAYEVTEP